MIIIDALLRVFDFVQALLLSGQLPQDNAEADIYNFINFFINLFSFLNI